MPRCHFVCIYLARGLQHVLNLGCEILCQLQNLFIIFTYWKYFFTILICLSGTSITFMSILFIMSPIFLLHFLDFLYLCFSLDIFNWDIFSYLILSPFAVNSSTDFFLFIIYFFNFESSIDYFSPCLDLHHVFCFLKHINAF